jgi:large subunit ribosomal protein L35
MPKVKTKKMVAKRMKVTARGKLVFARPGRSHLLSGKSQKRKRHLRRGGVVRNARDLARIRNLI